MTNILHIYLTNTHSYLILYMNNEIKEAKYNGYNKMGSFHGSNHN